MLLPIAIFIGACIILFNLISAFVALSKLERVNIAYFMLKMLGCATLVAFVGFVVVKLF